MMDLQAEFGFELSKEVEGELGAGKAVISLEFIARYPFIEEAGRFLKKVRNEALYEEVADIAAGHILDAIRLGEVREHKSPLYELLSKPVANAMIMYYDDNWLKSRYAEAEARRVERRGAPRSWPRFSSPPACGGFHDLRQDGHDYGDLHRHLYLEKLISHQKEFLITKRWWKKHEEENPHFIFFVGNHRGSNRLLWWGHQAPNYRRHARNTNKRRLLHHDVPTATYFSKHLRETHSFSDHRSYSECPDDLSGGAGYYNELT